jgi:hypothetical protein
VRHVIAQQIRAGSHRENRTEPRLNVPRQAHRFAPREQREPSDARDHEHADRHVHADHRDHRAIPAMRRGANEHGEQLPFEHHFEWIAQRDRGDERPRGKAN